MTKDKWPAYYAKVKADPKRWQLRILQTRLAQLRKSARWHQNMIYYFDAKIGINLREQDKLRSEIHGNQNLVVR